MMPLDDQFFRTEYGRLVARLSRRVGVRNIESIEDAVQVALAKALEWWPRSSVPDSPSAWLFRVALNHLVGELRKRTRREALAAEIAAELEHEQIADAYLHGEIRDDLLRMLFACCDDAIPLESQLVFALKVLCGFDVREIAQRLFVTEANVYKRLTRARTRLSDADFELSDLTPCQLAHRLPAVRSILYVLFTEGYLSSHAENAIRRDLCDDAVRLTGELALHPVSATPESFALLALMHLHRARLSARKDAGGGLILLEEQDRSLWDADDIQVGLSWLARSAQGDVFSRYHAEAGVAAEHCLAPSFCETRWERIVECYELLNSQAPSALHTLNHALALAECRGPLAGLTLLERAHSPSWLEGSYLWSAALADLHRRAGHAQLADRHRAAAIVCAPSAAIRTAIERRLRSRVDHPG